MVRWSVAQKTRRPWLQLCQDVPEGHQIGRLLGGWGGHMYENNTHVGENNVKNEEE